MKPKYFIKNGTLYFSYGYDEWAYTKLCAMEFETLRKAKKYAKENNIPYTEIEGVI